MEFSLNLSILSVMLTIGFIALIILWRDSAKENKFRDNHKIRNKANIQNLHNIDHFASKGELPCKKILFEAGMDNLDKEAMEKLDQNVLYLKNLIETNTTWELTLTGSADASGNQSRNKELTKKRGQNTKQYLIKCLLNQFPNSKIQDWESKIAIQVDKPFHGFTSQERELLRSVRMALN